MDKAVGGTLAADYSAKNSGYYGNPRADYVSLLPHNSSSRVLELGCGNGATGALAFREGKCGEYVGIEMFEPMAMRAREVLTRVHVGNVETMELPYEPFTFDALIISEVLEHLVDPARVLGKLIPLLKVGGLVLASSPNISHLSVIKGLIKGRFDYADEGLMDRTHLRWFTPHSFKQMFENAGVEVEAIGPVGKPKGSRRIFTTLMPRKYHHLSWYQVNLQGRRAH